MKKMYFLAFFALFVVSAHVWGADNVYDVVSVSDVQVTNSLGFDYLMFNFTGKRKDNGSEYNYSVKITLKSTQPQDKYNCGLIDVDGTTWYLSSNADNLTWGTTKRFLAVSPDNYLSISKDGNNYLIEEGTLTFVNSITTEGDKYIYNFTSSSPSTGGIDVKAAGAKTKVMKDGRLLILKQGKVFNAQAQEIR